MERPTLVSQVGTGPATQYASITSYSAPGGPSAMALHNGSWTETRSYNSRLQPQSIAVGSGLGLVFDYGATNNNGTCDRKRSRGTA